MRKTHYVDIVLPLMYYIQCLVLSIATRRITTGELPMLDKGLLNVANFLVEYLYDAIWVLARTALSPIFLIYWLLDDDREISEYDWGPR